MNRFKIGVPATYEHAIGDNKNDVGKSAKYIAESVLVSFAILSYRVDTNFFCSILLH